LQAEATHIKLTKQFEFARLEEQLEKIRAEYTVNEVRLLLIYTFIILHTTIFYRLKLSRILKLF